jgi:hypothetical protein
MIRLTGNQPTLGTMTGFTHSTGIAMIAVKMMAI